MAEAGSVSQLLYQDEVHNVSSQSHLIPYKHVLNISGLYLSNLTLLIARSTGYTCLKDYKNSSYLNFREVPLQVFGRFFTARN